MSLNATALAAVLHASLPLSHGSPSPEIVAWASGIIDELVNNGVISNSSGTITGTCANGAPLSNGAGIDGAVSGIDGTSMANTIASYQPSYVPASTELIAFCTAICDHIKNVGIVVFASGNITGDCSGGVLTNGAGTGGVLTALVGATLAADVKANVGYPSVVADLAAFCTALTTYLMGNTVCEYVSGDVTGTYTGAPLLNGSGSNGTLS